MNTGMDEDSPEEQYPPGITDTKIMESPESPLKAEQIKVSPERSALKS